MVAWFYALVSVTAVSLISFVGVLTLAFRESRLKKILIYMVSFAAGALLGDSFLHLLPEVVKEGGFGLSVSLSLMAGIVFFFVLEKIIDWHHHHGTEGQTHVHPLAITNLLGDAFHNFLDGVIIGVSYLVSIPAGIATTLAVMLHEIPQEIGDFGVLLHGGFSKAKALLFNFFSAFLAVIGAVLALVLGSQIESITAILVPFAAGSFIYIATADLIPELHKEVNVRKSLLQLGAFVLGIAGKG